MTVRHRTSRKRRAPALRLSVLAAAAFSAASISVAAQQTDAAPVQSRGWVRAYAEAPPPPPGTEIFAPKAYETLLETKVRETLIEHLKAQGYRINTDGAAGEGAYVLSYDGKVVEGRGRRLPESPIGVTADPGASVRNELGGPPVDPGIGASIRFKPNKGAGPEDPSVSLKIVLRRGGQAVWTAYAAGDVREGTRFATARAVARGLLAHFGENATIDEATFDLEAPAIADVEIVEAPKQ